MQLTRTKTHARLTAEERVAFHQDALKKANARLALVRDEVAVLQRELCQAQHILEVTP